MPIERQHTRVIELSGGLPPDLDQFAPLSNIEKEYLLKIRAGQYQEWGEVMAQRLEGELGKDNDMVQAARIFNQIASPLNNIFIAQIEKAKSNKLADGKVMSWEMYNGSAAGELKRTISQLLGEDITPVSEIILYCVKTKL